MWARGAERKCKEMDRLYSYPELPKFSFLNHQCWVELWIIFWKLNRLHSRTLRNQLESLVQSTHEEPEAQGHGVETKVILAVSLSDTTWPSGPFLSPVWRYSRVIASILTSIFALSSLIPGAWLGSFKRCSTILLSLSTSKPSNFLQNGLLSFPTLNLNLGTFSSKNSTGRNQPTINMFQTHKTNIYAYVF